MVWGVMSSEDALRPKCMGMGCATACPQLSLHVPTGLASGNPRVGWLLAPLLGEGEGGGIPAQ